MANYRVRIDRGDVQFEAEGDKKFVLEMLARFERPAAAPAKPIVEIPGKLGKGKRARAALPGISKSLSPGEFIRQFGFKRHTDFVAAFGYYLEKYSGLTEFAAGDINNCYYEAKMERSNTSQMIIQNIRRGYIMEAKRSSKQSKGAKKFTLTRSGEEHVRKALSEASEG
jgi:hypothetical protein